MQMDNLQNIKLLTTYEDTANEVLKHFEMDMYIKSGCRIIQ